MLAGSHPQWKAVGGQYVPPTWAASAKVSCVSAGRLGTIYWDEIQFYPDLSATGEDPRPKARKVGPLSIVARRGGVFDVKHGGQRAIGEAGLYLLGDSDTRVMSGQDLAQVTEDPQKNTFQGNIRDFVSDAGVRYKQEILPKRGGVKISYELNSADRPEITLKEYGVRFEVAPDFASSRKVFRKGKAIRADKGTIKGAQEIVFRSDGGRQIALFLGDEGKTIRVTERGSRARVEILAATGKTIGESDDETFAVWIGRASRLRLNEIQAEIERFDSADPVGAKLAEGAKIVARYEKEFPEETKRLQDEMDRLKRLASIDKNQIQRKLEDYQAADDAEREQLQKEIGDAIDEFKTKWAKSELEKDFDALKVSLDELVAKLAPAPEEKEAQDLLKKATGFFDKRANPMYFNLAKSYLGKIVNDARFKNTNAAVKAQQMLNELKKTPPGP